jgi:ABC-type transport system involved in multi-copper enzyme maturation permease subunit
MKTSFAVATVVLKELYRRKDFYVLFVFTALITLLLGTMSFFDDGNIVRYVKEVCLLLIWISGLVIAIPTAARQIPAERENRTILPLLAKPVTRGQLVVGKFLGCWLATGLALVLFYLFFTLVSGLRERAWPLASSFQALWLHWSMLGIVISFALFGSVVSSSNSTITFVLVCAILLVGRHLNGVALGLHEPASSLLYGFYFLMPHLEFFDLRELVVHGWGTVSWTAWALATAYGLAYMAFFLLLAWTVFRRQSLN